jgi:tetratricopeptide (TPR) repeat protein
MTRSSLLRPLAFGAILTAAVCTQVGAQQTIVARPGAPTDEVDRLHARAEALFEKPQSYAQAAMVLKRAADLLPLDESRRVHDRALAARLWYYAGARSQARETMKQAAGEALGQGAVGQAANLYTDACFIAIDQKNIDAARELYGAANRLSGSRHLAVAERTLLRSRLQSAYAQLAGK